MRYVIALTLVLIICDMSVIAQTPTPSPTLTPSTYALTEGVYEAEALSAPQIALSGTWAITGTAPTYLMGDAGAIMAFDFVGRWLIIWRATAPTAPTMQICIDSVCSTVGNAGETQASAIVALDAGVYGQHSATISLAGQVSLDQIGILQGQVISATPAPVSSPIVVLMPVVASPVPTQTPDASATPTPIQYEQFELTAEVDGTPVAILARREYVVTSGDDQITILLVGLLIISATSLITQLWRR